MNIMLSTNRVTLKALVITLLIFMMISAAPSAQTLENPQDPIRDDMILIADRYATKVWTANQWNIAHSGYLHTPDAVTNINDPNEHPQQPPNHQAGWWALEENIGVPYYWVGSTAIGDPDLGLYRDIEAGGYFEEKLLSQNPIYPAGDFTTETDLDGTQHIVYGRENGVDCVGFINNVWRLGTRAGTSVTNEQTLPIRLETLKRGDILMKYGMAGPQDGTGNHVVLFNEFDFDEPGVTKIKVYEIISELWKGDGEYLENPKLCSLCRPSISQFPNT